MPRHTQTHTDTHTREYYAECIPLHGANALVGLDYIASHCM
jgi:hypothetical protein